MTRSRGQTSLDFATGIALFVIATAFAFQFASGALDPYATTTDSSVSISNRAAEQLYQASLVGPDDESGTLNATVAASFFDRPTGEIRDELAIPDRYGFNVTVTNRTRGVLDVDGTTLAAGDQPRRGVVVAAQQRAGYVERDDIGTAIVRVRVWK